MNERQLQINPFEDGSALEALRGLPAFEEALARLLHTAEHGRPFGIVRGPAGTGKSALLEQVTEEFRHLGSECGHIDLRRTTSSEFAWRIACELGAAPASRDAANCWQTIEDTVMGRASSSRLTILLLDHLDDAGTGLVRDVHRLISIANASNGWCTILCAGRSPSPAVDAVACEHAELRIDLGPFSTEETVLFLQQVVARSGCASFSDAAMQDIHRRTGGCLRDILRLGRLSLLAQAAEDLSEVSAEVVAMVAGEVATPRSRPLLDSRSALPAVAQELTAHRLG